MIVEKLQLDPTNLGLLSVFFPGWTSLRDPLPPFDASPRVIVISERECDFYPSKQTIQITRKGAKFDSKEGFVDFLRGRGFKITPEQGTMFASQEDERFWILAKQMWMMGFYNHHSVEQQGSLFVLFRSLFEGFNITYPLFRKMHQPHRVVFSGLLTMMLKTQQTETTTVSPGYKKVLLANKVFYSHYRRAVVAYLDTPMAEVDFLGFLADISDAKKGQGV